MCLFYLCLLFVSTPVVVFGDQVRTVYNYLKLEITTITF